MPAFTPGRNCPAPPCCAFATTMSARRNLLAAHRARHDRALILDRRCVFDGRRSGAAGRAVGACRTLDAWLITDDAHGLGVVGAARGSAFAERGEPSVPLQMGTLSKAVGAYGGYLCASRTVIDFLQTRARTFIYSTGLPPPVIAAAIAALERDRTRAGLRRAAACARPRISPAPLICPRPRAPSSRWSSATRTRRWPRPKCWRDEGFLVIAIRPPTVPAGTARLRFAFTARHPDAEIARLADVVRSRVLRH